MVAQWVGQPAQNVTRERPSPTGAEHLTETESARAPGSHPRAHTARRISPPTRAVGGAVELAHLGRRKRVFWDAPGLARPTRTGLDLNISISP